VQDDHSLLGFVDLINHAVDVRIIPVEQMAQVPLQLLGFGDQRTAVRSIR
jgi:hypothetical protein